MESVNTYISQLSGELCLIWTQFIEVMVKNGYISNHLRTEYHKARVREILFFCPNSRESDVHLQSRVWVKIYANVKAKRITVTLTMK